MNARYGKLGMALGAAAAAALPSIAGDAPAESTAKKPNVLFILADDTTFEALGATGLCDVKTPNLDKLYRSGVVFTHTNNMGSWSPAVCIASRTMLNSGRTVNRDRAGIRKHPTWSQLMRDAGYKTYFTGKWHVFKTDANKVFDVARHIRPGMPKQTPSGYNRPKNEEDYKNGWKPWDKSKGGFWEGGTHWSVVVADDALDFIKDAKNSGKPFFIYLAFNAAHDPRQVPKKYIDMYPLDKIKVPENFLPEYPYAEKIGSGRGLRDEKLMPFPRTKFAVKVNRQEYYACVTYMDEQIGKILDALEKSGMADNTYIVFTADNGLALGHHGLAGKQNMYTPSLRLPFIIKGPGIKPGTKIDAPIYMQDIMPTTLKLAGAKVPEWVEFKSLLPLLKNPSAPHYDHIFGKYLDYQRMVEKDGWKLIAYPYTDKKHLLFNTKKDPSEMKDLAGNPEYAAKLEEMKALLEKAQQEMGDKLDTDNPPPIRKRKPRRRKK